MDNSGEQASLGELPSELAELAAQMGLDQSGTAYCDDFFNSFSDFNAYDNPYQALPISAFGVHSFEANTVWNGAVPTLPLDKYSPTKQYDDAAQPNKVLFNMSVPTTSGHVPWQASEPFGRDANINVTPEESSIPEDTPGAVSPRHQPNFCHSRRKSKAKPGKVHDGEILLACPFQRLDARKYHKCSKYLLRRIKDVKQHIYRCHKQPEYYCAICFHVFGTALERDDHIRQARCTKRPVPAFHGISDEQRRMLGRKVSSTLDMEEQWFEIWGVIFPGQKRPKSVVVGSPSEEALTALRIMWGNRGTQILKDVLGNPGAAAVQPGLMDTVVNSIFDCLETESASLPDDSGCLSPTGSVDSHGQSPFGPCASTPL